MGRLAPSVRPLTNRHARSHEALCSPSRSPRASCPFRSDFAQQRLLAVDALPFAPVRSSMGSGLGGCRGCSRGLPVLRLLRAFRAELAESSSPVGISPTCQPSRLHRLGLDMGCHNSRAFPYGPSQFPYSAVFWGNGGPGDRWPTHQKLLGDTFCIVACLLRSCLVRFPFHRRGTLNCLDQRPNHPLNRTQHVLATNSLHRPWFTSLVSVQGGGQLGRLAPVRWAAGAGQSLARAFGPDVSSGPFDRVGSIADDCDRRPPSQRWQRRHPGQCDICSWRSTTRPPRLDQHERGPRPSNRAAVDRW